MLVQLIMALVVVSAHGGFLQGSVHAFNLAIRLGVIRFGQAVFDAIFRAGPFKGMGLKHLSGFFQGHQFTGHGTSLSRRREMRTIVR